MNMNESISILLPAKNAESFLHECLNSILNQSEKDWELLVVDDHSDDRTFETLKEFHQKDVRIKPLKNKGKGIIDALQTAYSSSQGSFITRMDADDLMHENKLSTMKSQLLHHGTGHIATSLVKYFAEDGVNEGYQKYEQWLNGLTEKGENFKDIYKECVIPSPSWMLHRSDIEKIGAFQNLIYPEDYALTFEMYKAGLKVIPSNQVLHFWRDHENRASRNDPNYADNTFLPLKVKYFLALDHDPNKELILWGAGKKGKKIAQLLIDNKTPFKWICNNEKKWNKDVYGVKIKPVKENIKEKQQVIVSVANPDEKKNILRSLKNFQPNKDVFLFC